MTPETPHEQIVAFTDTTGTRHRIRFVPQNGEKWQRIEEVWQEADWRLVRQESVSDVDHWSRPVQR
jgi:hypothetical protein